MMKKHIYYYILGLSLVIISQTAQAQGTIAQPVSLGLLGDGTQTHTRNLVSDTSLGKSIAHFTFSIANPAIVTLRHRQPMSVSLASTILLNSSINSDNSPPDGSGFAYLIVELGAGEHCFTSYYQDGRTGMITTSIQINTVTGGAISPNLSAHKNYILSRTYTQEDGSLHLDQIQYFDGLGRPQQTIQRGVSPSKKDLVYLLEYDGFGRESTVWLPGLSSNNGAYNNPETIKSSAQSAAMHNDTRPYSKSTYENSPLNRISDKADAGIDWYNRGRNVKTNYRINISGDASLNCIEYQALGTNLAPTLQKVGNYASGELYVTTTTDEDFNLSHEFINKQGQVLLTRQVNHGTNHDTYYVYNDYGNLCFVLPPRINDEGIAQAELNNLAYLYKYDSFNRLIAKKLPGTEWIYYVYDKADQLICTQDGVMRSENVNKWLFTMPDALGRSVLTGTLIKSMDYTLNPLGSLIVKATRTNATDSYKGYSIGGLTGQSSVNILTVNYYDDYDFMGKNAIPAITDANFKYEVLAGYGTQNVSGYKGLLTGNMAAQLNVDGISTSYLYTVMYYDDRGNIIQTKSNNHLAGGIEKEYLAYNFMGQLAKKKHIHSATGKTTQTEFYEYIYDHAGRLMQTKHGLNTTAANILIATNTYDDLGRLKTNKKGSLPVTTYAYNVRSWLKSITGTLFSQTLYYNDTYGGSSARYNGNISAMSWKIQSETLRGYAFTYDGLSQITAANYLVGGATNTNYKVSGITYDKHGNMKAIERYGKTDSSYGIIDKLTMTHVGNQLTKVTDASTSVTVAQTTDFKDYSNTATEYTYNTNGAMTKDLNKGISSISYNFLNLPSRTDIKNKIAEARNDYTYSADGIKLKVVQKWNPNYSTTPVIGSGITVASLTQTKTTDYVGNKIYENGSLKRTLIDGGYIEGSTYYYYLTDHLGNNRVVATGTGTISQKNHYYPFGMTFGEIGEAEQGVQPYKYNGKEYDRLHGLNLYDYSARYMEPGLGRFTTVDPLAEKYYSISPYVYCGNNPMRFVDPDGKDIVDFIVGVTQSVASNMTAGLWPKKTHSVSNAGHYNAGRNVGDVLSILFGTTEFVAGATEAISGAIATASSGGTAAVITTSGTIGGAIKATHGAITTITAVKSLVTGEGRMEANGKSPNPNGSKGKSDHQQKVKDLEEKAQMENPGMNIRRETKIQHPESNRRPDVQVVDPKTNRTKKVYEAERRPNSQRNLKREEEYRRLGIEQETHKVGGK